MQTLLRQRRRLGLPALAMLLVVIGLMGCAAQPPALTAQAVLALPSPWRHYLVQGALPNDLPVSVLQRDALLAPARYRVVLIPGSGCTGFAPFIAAYTQQLLHAKVWVLHKPGVDIWAGAAPASCHSGFIEADALSTWQRDAQAAIANILQADAAPGQRPPPTWLVGISEGAELLPSIASALNAHQPNTASLAGMVLVGASGLDPREAGALQAQRLGATAAWQSLEQAVASDLPDTTIHQGRSLRYWRDMWAWQVRQPLLKSPLPILQVWGQADALVPPVAYERFAQHMRSASPTRAAPWCSLSILGADHGLQTPAVDGVQEVWFALEQWARHAGPAGLPPRWHCMTGSG